MGYTPEMKELIKRVENTRPSRIEASKKGEHFPSLSQKEIDDILKKYHPDYKEGTKRTLKAGPSKGKSVPNELADLFEAKSRLNLEKVNLEKVDFETDVLVIGGGGAGGSAALTANENGASVLILTKLRLGDANTMMAEGGIQAASKENDSPIYHYLDIMGGGHFTNTPELVSTLVKNAPSTVQWLEGLGIMFDKETDGSLCTLHGGGTSRKRMHSAGDMTGAEIMRTLRDEIKNRPQIKYIEFSPVIEVILDSEGQCAGAAAMNLETGSYLTIKAKTTIIATGGFGRLHLQGFPTTNHYGATADGLVMAYRAGCSTCFLDASQFHPTGVVYPEQNIGLLITEKIRGAGAQPVNIDGEQFVYPLETRDVESSAIIRECMERKKGVKTLTGRFGVWLDSPMIDILKGEGFVQKNFPAKYKQFMRHGIDVSKEPMLIFPTLHYQNGGIKINPEAESEIPNLFIAGEASGGIHGSNRLMGNSLLDITVFGRIAGRNAALKSKKVKPAKLTFKHIIDFHKEIDMANIKIKPVSPILLPDYAGKVV